MGCDFHCWSLWGTGCAWTPIFLTLSGVFSSVVSGIKDTGFSSRGLSLSVLCLVTKRQGEEQCLYWKRICPGAYRVSPVGLGFLFLGYSKFHVPVWKQFYKVFIVLQNRVLSQGKFKTHQRIRYNKMRAPFLQAEMPSDDILGYWKLVFS